MTFVRPARRVLIAAASMSALFVAAACGGGGGGAPAGGGGTSPATADFTKQGDTEFWAGKDTSGNTQNLIDQFNAQHPNGKVTFHELPDSADQQRQQMVQNAQIKNAAMGILSMDVVWTAEFAAKGWLQPLEGKMAIDTNGLLPATVKTATYNGKMYAAPQASDGGLLYYRKDLVKTPPKTWDEMMADCKIARAHHMGCYAGQFSKYEGLTVNAAEAINTNGGTVVAKDGSTPTVDSPEAAAGLARLAQAYKDGNIPKQAISYQEEQGRQAFEAGQLLFLRNWPYVYNLAKTDGSSKVKNSFGIAPLPGVSGGKGVVPGASSLGGHNAAISVYSDHKATAHDFLNYLLSAEFQKFELTQGSLAPVRADLYNDPTLQKKFPYLPTLLTSIQNAVPRPVTPFYPAVTKAIQDNAYAAIKGSMTPQQAVKNMSDAIKSASSS
jgi:multiple sugar transport system substrate-binding protein